MIGRSRNRVSTWTRRGAWPSWRCDNHRRGTRGCGCHRCVPSCAHVGQGGEERGTDGGYLSIQQILNLLTELWVGMGEEREEGEGGGGGGRRRRGSVRRGRWGDFSPE